MVTQEDQSRPNPKELLNSEIRVKFERKLEDKFQACEKTKANILSEKNCQYS